MKSRQAGYPIIVGSVLVLLLLQSGGCGRKGKLVLPDAAVPATVEQPAVQESTVPQKPAVPVDQAAP